MDLEPPHYRSYYTLISSRKVANNGGLMNEYTYTIDDHCVVIAVRKGR